MMLMLVQIYFMNLFLHFLQGLVVKQIFCTIFVWPPVILDLFLHILPYKMVSTIINGEYGSFLVYEI